ncbi:endonuclease-reverse transcriptase [Aphelenchoides avenae]|nr:endonuclease-reverse transcriptase [Aphelenchus avenae]
MEALEKVKFDIVGLSETHAKEERHSKWKHGKLRGSELHIGAADGLVGGIGFIVNAKLSSKIHSIDISSSRVGVLKIKLGRRHLLTVIQCYAPHSGYEDEEVEAFYAEIEQHLATQRGPVVILGDFNARVGPKEPDELYIGQHSAEERNDAGIRLAAFAEAQKMFVANTLFEKPLRKRWTWQSADLKTKSELDYVLYGDRKGIENLEVLNQFHARSDHRLVRATIRVDMKKLRKEAFHKRPRRPAELDKNKFENLVKEADWSGGGGRLMERYEEFQTTLTKCATDAGTRKESIRRAWKTPETEELLTQLRQAKCRGDSEEAKRLSKLCRKKQLARIFTQCLRKKKIPPQWKESTTVLLYKKGDARNLKNYRPICLLSVVYKLFTKVLTRRITDNLDREQPVEQAGFRQGYCTLDHLQTVNQIQEKAREKGLRQYLVFVDYEKAFDTVETNAVLNSLEAQGVHRRYIDLLEDVYDDSNTQITLFDKPIKIPIRRGVRQGDTIIPKLFTAAPKV